MDGLKKSLGNPVFFVVVYLVFMALTYILPYFGSNSIVMQAAVSVDPADHVAKSGLRLMFWLHLISLVVLCVLTWLRGSVISKGWLVILPIVAAVFDMVPGLSLIPLVPTVMHVLVLVLGVKGSADASSNTGTPAAS